GSRKVFAINPLAASRYRDRHGVSRKKSDPGDALVLANILRTDMAVHRPLPADSDLARAIAVLARAQQDAVWNRQQIGNQIRSLLREYYPAALDAFLAKHGGLAREEARIILAKAPTPTEAAQLSLNQLRSALKRAGRVRGVEAEADRLRAVLHAEYAHQPAVVEDAFGKQLLALLKQFEAACQASDDLAEAVDACFREHPDAEILLSFPGLGVQLAARVLAETGDDRSRFADARSLKAYAGSAPITRASGKKHYVGRRMVKNNRLHHAGYLWAFSSLRSSPGAQAHYRHRRKVGDWHAQAQRHLFNRLLGQLFHCLQQRVLFDEQRAFNSPLASSTAAAA
ncbi:IS110 family transposase, partial [Streptomyces sp. NPDC127197]|uniref:IS110 family transposase n=1 Tax=Streptomyces sp. NPDC127197 TaxID=3345388 RepID=UPI003635A35E